MKRSQLNQKKKYQFRLTPLVRFSPPAKIIEKNNTLYFDRGGDKDLIEIPEDIEIKEPHG